MSTVKRRRGASLRHSSPLPAEPQRRTGLAGGRALLLIAALPLSTCSPLPSMPGSASDWLGSLSGPPALRLDSLQVQITESFPLRVDAALRGSLPDCDQLGITQERQGNTFILEIASHPLTDHACQPIARAFEETVTLETDGLPAGAYQVRAGELSDSFDLLVDNIIRW